MNGLVEETAESRAVNAHALDAPWVRYCGALPPDQPPQPPNNGGSWMRRIASATRLAAPVALTPALSQREREQGVLMLRRVRIRAVLLFQGEGEDEACR